jgi:hypothetical protein
MTQVPASMTIYSAQLQGCASSKNLSIPNVCGVSYLLTKGNGHHGKQNELTSSNSKKTFRYFQPMQQPNI